jgi:hypothetical protein
MPSTGPRGSMIERPTFDQREAGASAESRHSHCQGTTGWGTTSKPEKLGLVYVKMDHRLRPDLQNGIEQINCYWVGSGICTASDGGFQAPWGRGKGRQSAVHYAPCHLRASVAQSPQQLLPDRLIVQGPRARRSSGRCTLLIAHAQQAELIRDYGGQRLGCARSKDEGEGISVGEKVERTNAPGSRTSASADRPLRLHSRGYLVTRARHSIRLLSSASNHPANRKPTRGADPGMQSSEVPEQGKVGARFPSQDRPYATCGRPCT